MPNKKLRDVSILITKGTTPTTVGATFLTSGINFIKSESITNSKYLQPDKYEHIDEKTDLKLKRSRLKSGDILFSIAGAYLGKVAIVQERDLPANTNQAVGIVRLDSAQVNNEYIYYYFSQNHINTYINKLSSQSSQPNLNLDLLGKLEFDSKSLCEQKKISLTLSALDNKIELNNLINLELQAIAKTLYEYWFLQFEFPDKNGRPYKSSGGKMVYCETIKREIPQSWTVNKLGKVLKTTLGGTPSTKEKNYWENADIAWLNSGEIANFPIISSEDKITQKGIDNSAAELLPQGSVVISIVRHIRVSILAIDAATNQSVVGIYETENLKHSFIHQYLSHEVPRLMSLRTGAQQPHINKGEVDISPIIIPDKNTLEKYYQLADVVYKKIFTTAFETEKLAELRDWLLPMLMNGQVKVE